MAITLQLPLETLQEAANLYNRYQAGAGFKAYLRDRMNLVYVMVALFVVVAIVCTAGTVVALAGARAFLMLFALILAPFILIGNLFVQSYMFFGWLENRALAEGLKHQLDREGPVKRFLRKHLKAQMGRFAPVPWLLAAVFLLLPLAATASVFPKVALGLLAACVVAVILFARIDS
jgi:hypothetical protein